MIQYVVYDSEGRILKSGTCQSSDINLQADSTSYVIPVYSIVDDRKWYVDASIGELAERQAITATFNKTTVTADGIDEAVLSVLPIPCTVYVDGVPEVIDDGSAEFSFTDPGTYSIVVDEVAYLRQSWEIEAI